MKYIEKESWETEGKEYKRKNERIQLMNDVDLSQLALTLPLSYSPESLSRKTNTLL